MRELRLLAALRSGTWGRGGAAVVWAVTWGLLWRLDGLVGLGALAMMLVVASTIASLSLPFWLSIATTTVSVLAFDFLFVPPRWQFSVALGSDVFMLVEVLLLSVFVAALLEVGRFMEQRAHTHATYADRLRRLGESLREAEDPEQRARTLHAALEDLFGPGAVLLVAREEGAAHCDPSRAVVVGTPQDDQLAALWHCARTNRAMGPGTDCDPMLAFTLLPLRGDDDQAYGAAALPTTAVRDARRRATLLVQARTLCDHMGRVLQRADTQRLAALADRRAREQDVRNQMLAAISHDFRTPLAAIMSAASSLLSQGERLAPGQRERLARSIVDETRQLGALADNTLQLVRLDAPGVHLHLDWESPDELVGASTAKARRHHPDRRMKVWSEPGLPLVRCDALLMSQLLDNLIDNAMKYSDPSEPVELTVRHRDGHVVFAVMDRGPGIDPSWRERIFDVFQRGDWRSTSTNSAAQRGAGVGLAVCRSIASAHGGELRLRPRAEGGSSFECWLPVQDAPAMPDDDPAGPAPRTPVTKGTP